MLIGQFSYASCQHPGPFDSGQGWKVAESVAAEGQTLPDDLTLTAAKRAGDFSPPMAPEFASREQMTELPSSLRLDPVQGAISCLLKSAAAGPDYTRRSSFFSHGVIVDNLLIDDLGPVRPAELWDWAWLHPIGQTEIEAATLDPTVTTCARAALTIDTVLPFAESHPAVFRPLLAGLESAIRDKKTLVLVEDDPAVASCWFAALQYFLPAAAAWSLPFNTWRRAADLLQRPVPGAYLVAVPSGDATALEALAAGGAIVVSATQPPSEEATSDGGISWRLGRSALVAGAWTRLAFAVLELDPWSRNGVWAAMDELAGAADAGGRTAPLWFLAAGGLKGAPDVGLEFSTALLAGQWPTQEAVPAELVVPLIERAAAAVENRYRFLEEIATRLAGSGGAGVVESGTASGPWQAARGTALVDRVAVGLLKEAMTDAVTPQVLSWPPELVGSESAMNELLDEVPAQLDWTRQAPRATMSAARAAIVAGWIVDSTWPGHDRARLAAEDAAHRHLLPLLIADDARPDIFGQWGSVELPETLWRNGVARFLSSVLGPTTASVPEEFAELAEEIRSRWALPRSARVHPAMRQWLRPRIDRLLLDTPAEHRPLPAPRRSAWDKAISTAEEPVRPAEPVRSIEPVSDSEPARAGEPVPTAPAEPAVRPAAAGPFAPGKGDADDLPLSGRTGFAQSTEERRDRRPAPPLPVASPAPEMPPSDISSPRFSRYVSLVRTAPHDAPPGWAANQVAELWRNDPAELGDLARQVLQATPWALHDSQLLDRLLAETSLGAGQRLVAAYHGDPGVDLILQLHDQFADRALLDTFRGRYVTNELTKQISGAIRRAESIGWHRRTRFIDSCEDRLAALILLMDPAADSEGRDLSRMPTLPGLRLDLSFYSLPFDRVWQQLSTGFRTRSPLSGPPLDYYKALALLHARSVLKSADDPALEWLQGTSGTMGIPFSNRLVHALSWAPSDGRFWEQVRVQALALTNISEVAVSDQRNSFFRTCVTESSRLIMEAEAIFKRR